MTVTIQDAYTQQPRLQPRTTGPLRMRKYRSSATTSSSALEIRVMCLRMMKQSKDSCTQAGQKKTRKEATMAIRKNKQHTVASLDARRRRIHLRLVERYWELDRDFVDLWGLKERAVIELKLCRRDRVRDTQRDIVQRLERELAHISRQRDKYGRWASCIYYWMMIHDLAAERVALRHQCNEAAEELQTINFV